MIDDSDEQGRRGHWQAGFSLMELLLAIALIAVLLALMGGAYSRLALMGQRTRCMGNVRSLYHAFHQYASDHNNCFPQLQVPGGNIWPVTLERYLPEKATYLTPPGAQGITYCPSTKMGETGFYRRDAATWRTDYNLNPSIFTNDASKRTRAGLPASVVLLWDGPGGNNTSASGFYLRHLNHFVALFADGHTELLSERGQLDGRWSR